MIDLTEIDKAARNLILDYRAGIIRQRAEESQAERFDATLEEIVSAPPAKLVVMDLSSGKFLSGILRNDRAVYATKIEQAKVFDAVTELETAKRFGVTLPAPWFVS